MSKRLTNDQVLARLMKFSRSGALMQAFIIEACRRYAEACAEAPAETFDSPLLHGAAWKACAVELRDTLEAHLKG